jgi:arylsulfatase A
MKSPSRREILQLTSAFAGATMASSVAWAATPQRAPNFIIVMADDLGYGDLGSYGSRLIKTPHLDAMVRGGLKMTDFYASANVCTPSRAGLLTGRYPIRTGLAYHVIQPSDSNGLPSAEVTLAEALKATHRSALIGKWHLGHVPPYWPPTTQGFDLFYGLPFSHDMKTVAMYTAADGVQLAKEDTQPSLLTQQFFDRGISFVEANRANPFLLVLALTAPHIPLNPHPDHKGHSEAAAYGDVVEEIDTQMGRLIARLKALKIDKDTVVIVTSDNGPWFEGSAAPLRDRKGAAGWDGGYRVPFIAWGPGRIPAGRTSTAMAMNIDIFPTLLAQAGAAPPAGIVLDGRDLSDVWRRGSPSPHEELILFDNEKVAAIRTDRWKFVARSYYRAYDVPLARIGANLLFDIRSDPAENYNLASKYPEVVKDMRARFDRARALFEPFGVKGKRDTLPDGTVID